MPGSSAYFYPEQNGWRADTRRRQTLVCAGGGGYEDHGAGRFMIFRSRGGWTESRRGLDRVTIAAVGPLKITMAPHGPDAATRGQLDGKIAFRSENGTTGTLHLKDDTVTLNK
jgi:hypothetical protein